MSCRELQAVLPSLLDEELEAAESSAALEHLAACPACAERVEAERRLQGLVREGLTRAAPIPVGLTARVLRRIAAEERPAAMPLRLPSLPLRLLAAAALLFMTIALMVLPVGRGEPVAFADLARTATLVHGRMQDSVDPGRRVAAAAAELHLTGLTFEPCVPEFPTFERHLAAVDEVRGYGRGAVVCYRKSGVRMSHIDLPATEVRWDGADRYEFQGRVFYCQRVGALEVVCLPAAGGKLCLSVTDASREEAVALFHAALEHGSHP